MRVRIGLATVLGILSTLSMAFAGDTPVFDPTINLGVIIHLATLVASILVAFFVAGRFVERQKLEFLEKIQLLHDDMTKKIGVLSERVVLVETRVGDLWESWKNGR